MAEMQTTRSFETAALQAAKKLLPDDFSGVQIPEMDGYLVIQKGKAPNPETVIAIIRDESGNEFEIYTIV